MSSCLQQSLVCYYEVFVLYSSQVAPVISTKLIYESSILSVSCPITLLAVYTHLPHYQAIMSGEFREKSTQSRRRSGS